jgi:hypothetical protein
MTLFHYFKQMFKTPTPLQMAAAELANVELELLKAETYVEYANSIVMYNTARAKRLRAYIDTQNRAQEHAE